MVLVARGVVLSWKVNKSFGEAFKAAAMASAVAIRRGSPRMAAVMVLAATSARRPSSALEIFSLLNLVVSVRFAIALALSLLTAFSVMYL